MTTKARKRTKNSGLMKLGVWNVRGLCGKEKLLQEELKKANVDIAVIPTTYICCKSNLVQHSIFLHS